MGATAALKLRQITDNFAGILGLELLCAAQGIDLRRKMAGAEYKLGDGTEDLYTELRNKVPFLTSDVLMKPHIDASTGLIRERSH
jgi:histidine ammonia-lyase